MKISPLHWLHTVVLVIPAVVVSMAVVGTVSLVSSQFDRTGRFAHRCARWWAWVILASTGVRVRVEGLQALSPDATYVFVSNHQSFYDIPVLFWSLPYQLRAIAKESLGSVPFLGWHLQRAGHLLVDRRNPDREAILRRWRELVTMGLSLIIFPEGTRSADGRVGRFKAGSFMLALQAGLPVVPLSVAGTRSVMPRGRLTVVPGIVRVTVHPPIVTRTRVETPEIDDARALAAEVQGIVSAGVEALNRERGA